MGDKLCTKCGNTKYLISGELCECSRGDNGEVVINRTTGVTFIPKDYIGMRFDPAFMQPDMQDYANFMGSLYDSICRYLQLDKTIFISSPRRRSKQVFAYSALQFLAGKNMPIFPYVDIAEAGRFIRDIDHGKVTPYLQQHNIDPDSMYTVPVLFLKTVINASSEMLNYTAMVLDRRSRQGGHTILFSHLPWSDFTRYDRFGGLRSMAGDGRMNTIQISAWGDKQI